MHVRFYLGAYTNLYPYCLHLLLIWAKFGIRDLHVMVLIIPEFLAKRGRTGRTFLFGGWGAGGNEITFTRVPWNRMTIGRYRLP